MKARIAEIFSSVQGEGLYFGRQQLFIRFYGCNLSCVYCDTPLHAYRELTLDEVIGEIALFDRTYHSLSITGGEPLLQAGFLSSLLPVLKRSGNRIYLETNGTLPEALARVIGWIDIIAMDYKLFSAAGSVIDRDAHDRFLRIAAQKNVFVKTVIGEDTRFDELKPVILLISSINKNIPLIIQPQHPLEEQLKGKGVEFRRKAGAYLTTVKLIPQMHKAIGVR